MTAASDAKVPSRLEFRDWLSASRVTGQSAFDLDTSLRCAGVAFFGFLSVFPALSAAISVFGLVADPGAIDVKELPFAVALPGEVIAVINEQVAAFAERDAKLSLGLAISLAIALWSGSRGMNALIFAITRAYREDEERGFIRSVLMSFAATIAAFVVVSVIVTAVTLIPVAALILPFPESRETAVLWLRWPVVTAVLAGAVLMLYRYAPNRRSPRARWVVPGAVLATLLWLIVSVGLSFFVENFGSYNATFGSIAAAAIFMLWLYASAVVLVSGARLNAELEWRTRHDTTVGPDRPMGEREAYVADTLAPEMRDGG
ncbi:MAG: YihY/virulence factor BrkB family protein [Hoeflea sp.]|uniref:YihY/virulence factor BrkB family protein n=1 Tax=Hoeflea sp. TaxID=1940281 RepID=UPI0032EC97CA